MYVLLLPGRRRLAFEYDANTTVGDIKASIHEKRGIHTRYQGLRLRGRYLRIDNQSLEGCGIEEGDCLDLEVRNTADIFVKLPTEKTIVVACCSGDTVHALKEMIEGKEGIPAEKQRLAYAGKMLEDERTCADYNI